MNKPFIRNHQYNLIKKQVDLLQNTCITITDPKVVESVRYSAQVKMIDAFLDATEIETQILEKASTFNTSEEYEHYLRSLEPYLIEFPSVTAKQLKKLFPKNKKLKIPDLNTIDYRYVTYLGWMDIATNKLFVVYHMNGKPVGVEGRITPTHRKGICFLCNRHEEVALFSAITKTKPAKAASDYYKAIGNYMCVDSATCNKNITDVTALERFIVNIDG